MTAKRVAWLVAGLLVLPFATGLVFLPVLVEPPEEGPDIRNDTAQSIMVYVRPGPDSDYEPGPISVGPGQRRILAGVNAADQCLGPEETQDHAIAVYEEDIYDYPYPRRDLTESDQRTDPAVVIDLEVVAICDGELWDWTGETLARFDRWWWPFH